LKSDRPTDDWRTFVHVVVGSPGVMLEVTRG